MPEVSKTLSNADWSAFEIVNIHHASDRLYNETTEIDLLVLTGSKLKTGYGIGRLLRAEKRTFLRRSQGCKEVE